jgi:hypothetical protein
MTDSVPVKSVIEAESESANDVVVFMVVMLPAEKREFPPRIVISNGRPFCASPAGDIAAGGCAEVLLQSDGAGVCDFDWPNWFSVKIELNAEGVMAALRAVAVRRECEAV